MKHHYFFITCILILVCQNVVSQTLRKWEVFELKLTARRKIENPYALISPSLKEGFVKVEFQGVSGVAAGKSISVIGFWDGGQNWKVRFAPPEAGVWEYKSVSEDKGLARARGKITVIDWLEGEKEYNPTRRGPVQVMKEGPNPGHFFQYADGKPFLWIADTWWNWTNRKIKFETFKTLVDDRSAKGFNIGQLFVAANGWGRASSLLNESYDVLDVTHMQKVDIMIAYANSKGMTVWIHGWWSRENLARTAKEEKIKRWWRYLVHRLGAYNVIWVIAGEYNLDNYGNMGLPFWKDLGKLIKDEDPYERIISAHNTPPGWSGGDGAPQWSTTEAIHDQLWLDYNQSQVGHGKWYNERIPQVVKESYDTSPPKPIVVTEPWYEFIEGSAPAIDIRFGAWSAILSGAAGHTYGGGHVWLAHTPEAPSGGGPWPLEKEFTRNTLNYPGALSMSYLAKFFEKIEWWKLSPHAELVSEYPQPFCLADPGKEYVLYLRWAGRVALDLSAYPDTTFEYYWFDPSSGKTYSAKEIKGGHRYFSAPESYPTVKDYNDWVLHVRQVTR